MNSENGNGIKNGIAIVGMVARVPGARNLEEFWQVLREGKETISFLSDQDLDGSGVPQSVYKRPEYVRAAGILEDVDLFDASFFDVSPNEARLLDPQHRIFLECAWEVLERTGYSPYRFDGAIGVFAGCSLNEYSPLESWAWNAPQSIISKFMSLLATDKDYLATRLSYKLNLKGPGVTVQSACSTSLVAVHLACQSLMLGECDLALAGGITIRPPQKIGYSHTPDMIFSRDGHTRTFDEQASGTIFANGAGIVALKRLEDAITQNDHIEAIILGSAINNDGSRGKSAFSAPSTGGQAEVIAQALGVAEVSAESISYLEAHGTATIIGDPIEVEALTNVFRTHTDKKQYCAIGSVKSNIGHTVHAAGVIGLIKTVLMLKHKVLVPSTNFERPNPQIDFLNSPFFINTLLREWKASSAPRRAGVSSFGVGGTNAHIILEEAPSRSRSSHSTGTHILKLSAKSEPALRTIAGRFAEFIQNSDETIGDICYTANTGRSDFNHRLGLVASTREEYVAQLRRVAEESSSIRPALQKTRIAFLFTGQGSQYLNMGKTLYDREQVFRKCLEHCDEVLSDLLPERLLPVLFSLNVSASNRLDQTLYTQPAIFAIEYALAELWRHWGVEPDVLLGHSLGEYAAACVAGVFSLEDGLRLVAKRAALMNNVRPSGEMVAVFASAETIEHALKAHNEMISIAAINTPDFTVISGDGNAISQVLGTLESQHIAFRKMKVSHAFHSPFMNSILQPFQQEASGVRFDAPKKLLISNLNGKVFDESLPYDAEYLRRHMRETVQFVACIQTLKQQDCNCVIEIGPHPVLIDMVRPALSGQDITYVASLNRQTDEHKQILGGLAKLYSAGIDVHWEKLHADQKVNRLEMPTYPFLRQRFWIDRQREGLSRNHARTRLDTDHVHPLLGRRLPSPLSEIQFETVIDLNELGYLKDHRVQHQIVFPAACYLEMIVAAAREIAKNELASFRDIVFREPLFLDDSPSTLHLVWRPLPGGNAAIEIFHRAGETWKLHVSCEYVPITATKRTKESLDSIKSRIEHPVDIGWFYAHKKDIGMQHGATFQGVHELWKGNREALGRIQLPHDLNPDIEDYFTHPVLMDCCIQVKESAFERSTSNRNLYLPFLIEEFNVYGKLTSSVWGWAGDSSSHKQDDLRSVNILALDVDKKLQVEIRQLHLKSINKEAYAKSAEPANIYELQWVPRSLSADAHDGTIKTGRRFVLLCDTGQEVGDLTSLLQGAGEVIVVRRGSPNSANGFQWSIGTAFEDFEWLLDQLQVGDPEFVFMWGGTPNATHFNPTEADNALESLFLFGKALMLRNRPAHFVVVTRGAQKVKPAREPVNLCQAAYWGFTKVLQQEQTHISCRLIDLDSKEENLTMLADEIVCRPRAFQVAYRDGERLRPQIVRKNTSWQASGSLTVPSEPFHVEVRHPGILDSLVALPQTIPEPAAGEILIEVHATGLNFRDVLIAMGRFAGAMGFECSGVVVKTGAGVTRFRAGDEVLCLALDGFSSFIAINERHAIKKPDKLTMEEAAGIPIIFSTAHHALKHCARLQRGETILIHAAAGGVGLAAIELARQVGAEIFATASRPKWDYLRSLGIKHIFNSRTLEFVEQIRQITNGKGVDVVLNSLANDFIEASIEILGDHGRFVEIGATNILDSEQFAKRKPLAIYNSFHLRKILVEDPAYLASVLGEIIADLAAKRYRMPPVRVFSIGEAPESFRFMAQAKHIGKIVISMKKPERQTFALRTGASYLVTGGLGALGLCTAQWLADKGAETIILMGRRPPSDAADNTIRRLRERGVQVSVMQTDVASFTQVQDALRQIHQSMPPLRGIWHAAGVLSDSLLLNQTGDKLRKVSDPKIHGAWNLHQLTADSNDIDCFVLFSSMSALWGAAGQTTYAAANAFLDALAHYRRQLNLPALSINWGSWGGGGMAASLHEKIIADRVERGLLPLDPNDAFHSMERALTLPTAQVGITEIDWSKFLAHSLYDDFYFEALGAKGIELKGQIKNERTRIRSLPSINADANLKELMEHLNEIVAETLGIPAGDMSHNDSISALGIDSLMSLELSNRIQKSLGIRVPMVMFLKGLTIQQLAGELLEIIQVQKKPHSQLQ